MKYFSVKPIREKHARYNVIFGERSNGKTYSPVEEALIEYSETGRVLALVRRWDSDFSGQNSAKTLYDTLIYNGDGKNRVREIFKDQYDSVEYYGGRYYLAKYDEEEGKTVRDPEKCICVGFALNQSEHYKSGSFPQIGTILFDEFTATRVYLADEFVLFMNLISTIVRQRDDVIIYMCGNTIDRYCPYFKEMGLYRVKNMKPGDIDVYEYGSSGLRVAVQYADSPAKKKASDVYFAFDNPALKMITDGSWQLDMYPHAPCSWIPAEVVFCYFIIWGDEIFQCDIVYHEDLKFTFIHRKTTPIKRPDRDLIFTTEYNPRPNYRRKLTKPQLPIEDRICWFFRNEKVYYQDNETGNAINAYLEWSRKA